NRQAGAGEVIYHGEDPKPPAVLEDVEDEVERPAFIDPGGRSQPRHTARSATPAAPPTNGEAFLRVDPIHTFDVHGKAFSSEQDVEPSIPEAPALTGECSQPVPQPRPLLTAWPVATGRATEPDEGTRPALAQLELGLDRPHRGPLRHGR